RRGGDNLQSAAAVRAVLHVDVEDPFEQPGPAHARGFSLGRGVIGRGRGGTLCRSGNDFTVQLRVGRQHPVEAAAFHAPASAVRASHKIKSATSTSPVRSFCNKTEATPLRRQVLSTATPKISAIRSRGPPMF